MELWRFLLKLGGEFQRGREKKTSCPKEERDTYCFRGSFQLLLGAAEDGTGLLVVGKV